MNAFIKQDQIGRDKTIMLFPKLDLVESPNQYSVWDMSGMTTNIAGDVKPFLMEVKDRDVKSSSYETVFMEVKKYQALTKLADENNIQDIFYINHYTDNITYVFNLKNIKVYDLQLVVKKAPKTTMGATEYVDKIFVELPIHHGRKYNNK